MNLIISLVFTSVFTVRMINLGVTAWKVCKPLSRNARHVIEKVVNETVAMIERQRMCHETWTVPPERSQRSSCRSKQSMLKLHCGVLLKWAMSSRCWIVLSKIMQWFWKMQLYGFKPSNKCFFFFSISIYNHSAVTESVNKTFAALQLHHFLVHEFGPENNYSKC